MTFLRVVGMLCVWVGSVVLAAETPPLTPPTQAQIEQWVKDLSSEDFDARELAEQKLKTAGLGAVPLLEKVVKEGEEEAKQRAGRCLDGLRWAVRPEVTDLATIIPKDAPLVLMTNNLKAGIERLRAGTPLGKFYDDPKHQEFKKDFGTQFAATSNMNAEIQELTLTWLEHYGGPGGISMLKVDHTKDWPERQWMGTFFGLNGKNPLKDAETFEKYFPVMWSGQKPLTEKYRGIEMQLNGEQWGRTNDARVNRLLLRTSHKNALTSEIDMLAADAQPTENLTKLEYRNTTLASFVPNPVASLYFNLPAMVQPEEKARPNSSFLASGFAAAEHTLIVLNEQNGLFLEQAAMKINGERKGVIKLMSQPVGENRWLRVAPASTLGGIYLKLNKEVVQNIVNMNATGMPTPDFITLINGDCGMWMIRSTPVKLMPDWAGGFCYADEATAKGALGNFKQFWLGITGDAKAVDEAQIENHTVYTVRDDLISEAMRSALPVSPAVCAHGNALLIASTKEELAKLIKQVVADEAKKADVTPELAKLIAAIPAEERGGMVFFNYSQLAAWGLPQLWQHFKTDEFMSREKLATMTAEAFPKPDETLKNFPGELFSIVETKDGLRARAVGSVPFSLTFMTFGMFGGRYMMMRAMQERQLRAQPAVPAP